MMESIWSQTAERPHFPFFNNRGLYFLKLYQHRSYVIALRHTPGVDGMYIDASKNGLSFRSFGDLLLLGGGGHRTGKNGGNWQELSDFAERYYPEAEEAARWAAQDCMSLDGIPYIGQYAKSTPDLFVASGFNKWGMTGSMAAALLLTDLVRGIENPYQALFSPSRSVLHPQLALNAAESVIGLLTPTAPRCPHLGCALKYNRQEHSWDCSCHGSRFTEDGAIIDNPAAVHLHAVHLHAVHLRAVHLRVVHLRVVHLRVVHLRAAHLRAAHQNADHEDTAHSKKDSCGTNRTRR